MSVRPAKWSILAVLGLCAASCGILELGAIGRTGETADTARAIDVGAADRWVLPIVVDPDDLPDVDADVVELAFNADELACFDGAAIRPDAVAAGWSVTFERADDPGESREAVDPPVLRADQVRVDCPADDADG